MQGDTLACMGIAAGRGRLERRAVAIPWDLHFQYSPEWRRRLRVAAKKFLLVGWELGDTRIVAGEEFH